MLARLTELTCFLGAIFVLALPGVLAIDRLRWCASVAERWILGTATAWAVAVYLAFGLSHARLSLFMPVWLVLTSVLLVLRLLRRRSQPPLLARPNGARIVLAAVLTVCALSRFGVSLLDELPPGWDSAFHLILAKKLALTDHVIVDWRPFEDISLNYPLGSHGLVAVVSQLAHIPLHTAFKLLIPAFGVLTTGLVFLFAANVSGRDDVAAWSALAYGWWALYGSIDYYRWGGLPNAIAMAFLTAALAVIARPSADRSPAPLVAVLLASTVLTHHHVMIVAGCLLVVVGAFSLARTERRRVAVAVASGLGGAALLASFYLVPYAAKAGTIGATGVLRFQEVLFTPWTVISSVGVVFFLAASAGAWLIGRSRDGMPGLFLLHVVAGTLLVLFVVCEYVYRGISHALYGTGYVAFTPSRFLTDLVYPASVYAGFAVARARERWRVPDWGILAVGCALALTNLSGWTARDVQGDPRLFRAFAWIESHTPTDALVLNTMPWAPYGTWRRCAATPIPVSEPPREDTPKARLFQALARGVVPDEARNATIVQVIDVTREPPYWPTLWADGTGLAIVELQRGRPQ
jgi:hypothetical protein